MNGELGSVIRSSGVGLRTIRLPEQPAQDRARWPRLSVQVRHEPDHGGWSTITMVTRYAKKMPNAYQTEIMAWLEGSFGPVLNACNKECGERKNKPGNKAS